ncbi:MAG: non-ribosomal peptide synthetase, partial [Chloroflexota bacterium]
MFQVLFVLQNQVGFLEQRLASARGGAFRFEPAPLSVEGAQYDLTLELREPGAALSGSWKYASDLFDRSTILRFHEHFEALLDAVLEQPQTRVSRLPLLAAEQRRQIVVDWNRTERDYPLDEGVLPLFAARVARQPDAAAVSCQGRSLTYRQLDRQSTDVAARLRRHGVPPGARVGNFLNRSERLLTALLGTWKAGATYVPLDPAYPRARLASVIEDAALDAVIVESGTAAELPAQAPALLSIDNLAAGPAPGETPAASGKGQGYVDDLPAAPLAWPGGDDLAYVMYTSGSTGRPKGVMIRQRSVANFLCSMRDILGFGPDDTLLAVSTLSFDVSVLELFLPLIAGGRVEVLSRADAVDGLAIQRRLAACRATFLQATPATWRLLLGAGWRPTPRLTMLSVGEALDPALADDLLQNGGTLWNLYGPTETTVYSTVSRVERGSRPVLIGRPIANTQVYVLDPHGEPAPIGVTGELYIGGAGVAAGYWRQPELTAARFPADPFSGRPAARLYRTGDLARFQPDGRLECLGRLDFQLKVRGFRIEAGDVEAALQSHPAIREAVVAAKSVERAPNQPEKRLVAYYTTADRQPLAGRELRAFLTGLLPEYMIPSDYVRLEAFPLTPNRKINRLALPDPVEAPAPADVVPPRTDLEARLAEIWQGALRRTAIGIDENFFDLGGHSLLVARVQA